MNTERDSDLGGAVQFAQTPSFALADLHPLLAQPSDPVFLLSSSGAENLTPFTHNHQLSSAASFDCVPLSLPKPHFPTDPSLFLDLFSSPLPALHSLEHPLPGLTESSSSQKRVRLRSSPASSQSFNCKYPYEISRKRRQKIGDKTRCLQKLMPWNKKMDTATMLEEAHKYVRFLQAQVAVLQAMPISSSFGQINVGPVFGLLGMLNRQQLLQVVVNSPVAQTVLSEQGLCVFAYEQLVMLRKAAALPPPSTFRG